MRLHRPAALMAAAAAVAVAVSLPARADDEADRERQSADLVRAKGLTPLAQAMIRFMAVAHDGKLDEAGRIFRLSADVRHALTDGEAGRLLARVNFTPPAEITVVSFDLLTPSVVTVTFVATTADGPVAVRLSMYVHDHAPHLGRFEATDDWDRIASWAAAGTRLPVPYNIELNPAAGKRATTGP